MDFKAGIIEQQQAVCIRYQTLLFKTPVDSKVGVSLNIGTDIYPINGLRHIATEGVSGWYIWAGEHLSHASDFFHPIHAAHLQERCPNVIKYLGLPPGWRFLIADNYEDVWFDATLLEVNGRN